MFCSFVNTGRPKNQVSPPYLSRLLVVYYSSGKERVLNVGQQTLPCLSPKSCCIISHGRESFMIPPIMSLLSRRGKPEIFALQMKAVGWSHGCSDHLLRNPVDLGIILPPPAPISGNHEKSPWQVALVCQVGNAR